MLYMQIYNYQPLNPTLALNLILVLTKSIQFPLSAT